VFDWRVVAGHGWLGREQFKEQMLELMEGSRFTRQESA
jgi:hypothetical protein